MTPLQQFLVSAIAPILVFGGAWVQAKYSRKTGRESNSTADWSAFVSEHREWTEKRLAERDERIDSLSAEIKELRERFDDLQARYRSAVAYIRRLVGQLKQHVPAESIERPPESISPDL